MIYTTGSKIAEHGGLSPDDLDVPLFVSNPCLKAANYTGLVETRQIGPTVVKALGFDPLLLQGVQIEGTPVLPGLW